jgi:hypothetical protein
MPFLAETMAVAVPHEDVTYGDDVVPTPDVDAWPGLDMALEA